MDWANIICGATGVYKDKLVAYPLIRRALREHELDLPPETESPCFTKICQLLLQLKDLQDGQNREQAKANYLKAIEDIGEGPNEWAETYGEAPRHNLSNR